jgi:hypothetical protein
MQDRRPWVRDIALYLAGLTRAATVAGPGQWALLSRAGANAAAAALDGKTVAELRASLEGCERDLRLLRRENAQLRTTDGAACDGEARQRSIQGQRA